MKLQARKSSCGPAALSNALEALGLVRTEEELISLCGQTTDGTTEKGLRKAIDAIGGLNKVIHEGRADVAMLFVLQALYEGRPVIVCVDDWQHWAVAAGTLGFGKRIVCVDSGDNDLVRMRTLDEFVEWWAGPEAATRRWWGVVV